MLRQAVRSLQRATQPVARLPQRVTVPTSISSSRVASVGVASTRSSLVNQTVRCLSFDNVKINVLSEATLDKTAPDFVENANKMESIVADLQERIRTVNRGGGDKQAAVICSLLLHTLISFTLYLG
jgi:hypothetical protein